MYMAPATVGNNRVFDEDDLQLLWEEALEHDSDHTRIKEAITSQDTTKFPASLGLQAAAQMAEATLAALYVSLSMSHCERHSYRDYMIHP